MITALADAVTAALNAHTFTQTFTAVRVTLPDLDPKDTEELQVNVMAGGRTMEIDSRKYDAHDMIIEVAVIQRVEDTSNAQVDPLIALCEEIAAFLKRQRMGDYPCLSVAIRPLYDYARLKERNLFMSVVHATYRGLA